MVELYFICFFIDLNLSYIRIYNKKIDYAFKVQAVNSQLMYDYFCIGFIIRKYVIFLKDTLIM